MPISLRATQEVRFKLIDAFPRCDGFARAVFRLTVAANDLWHDLRLMGIEDETGASTEAETTAEDARRAFAFRLICGHAFEGLDAFRQVSRCTEVQPLVRKLEAPLEAEYRALEILVPRNGSHPLYETLSAVRSTIAFHYDKDATRMMLEHVSADYEARIQLGATTHYVFADQLAHEQLGRILGPGVDPRVTLMKIRDEVHVPLMHVATGLLVAHLERRRVGALRHDLAGPPT